MHPCVSRVYSKNPLLSDYIMRTYLYSLTHTQNARYYRTCFKALFLFRNDQHIYKYTLCVSLSLFLSNKTKRYYAPVIPLVRALHTSRTLHVASIITRTRARGGRTNNSRRHVKGKMSQSTLSAVMVSTCRATFVFTFPLFLSSHPLPAPLFHSLR